MASVLEIIARGKNETSPLFQAVQQGSVIARNTLRELHKEVDGAGKTWQLNASDVAKWAGGFMTAQAVLGGFKAVYSSVTAFVGDSIKSFASAEAANTRLTVALQRQGQATPAVKEQFGALSAEFQRTTKYGDDLVTEMQALLVQVGGVMPSQMKGALKASSDLASGLGIDLRQATMLVGKAFAGETGTLARYGIVIDDAKVKSQGAQAVLEAINEQFGGQAQAELDTYTGKVENIANAWDNVKESIGGSIIQYPLLETALRGLQTRANGVSDAAGQTKIRLSQIIPSLPGTDATGWLVWLEDYAEGLNTVARMQEQLDRMPPPPMFRAEEAKRVKDASVDMTHFNETIAAWVKEDKKAQEQAEAHAKALQGIRDKLTGAGLIRDVADLTQAWNTLTPAQRADRDVVERLVEQYGKLREKVRSDALPADLERLYLQHQKLLPATQLFVDITGHAATVVLPDLSKRTDEVRNMMQGLQANGLLPVSQSLAGFAGLAPALGSTINTLKTDVTGFADSVRASFSDLGNTVANAIGGTFGTILSTATGLMDQFLQHARGSVGSFLSSGTGQRIGGAIGVGLQGFDAGLAIGGLTSNRGVGVAAGAATGAATGALYGSVVPGVGTAVGAGVGAIAGAIGGWMASNKRKKEEEAALKDLQAQLLETFKGMEKLKSVAAEVGVNIDKAFDMKDRKKALATIEQFSKALEDKKTRLEGLAMAQDGLNYKVTTFADGLKNATVLTDDQQAAIGRYANFATAVFRQQVRETGDVFAALESLEPALGGLSDLQKQFGFETKETYQRLLNLRDTVHANEDVARSIQANTQMMHGFKDANIMTRDIAISFAKEAVADYQTLRDRQVDSATAMVMMQDELQMLWERQKKFGDITDEATLELLKQAEAQNIVGEASRSHNDKMLEALLGVKKELENLAHIFMDDLPNAARGSANEIARAYDGIRIRPIKVPIEYDDPGMPNFSGPSPTEGFAPGGYVPFTPGGRVVRVAERETERIVSDRQLSAILSRAMTMAGDAGGQPSSIVASIHIGERHLEDIVIDLSNRGLRNGRVRVPERAVVERTF